MKITIWHKSGAGTEHTADDFACIEVDGKTVWSVAMLKSSGAQSTPCPMCGTPCTIGGDDKEGTHYYVPVK